MKRPALSSRRTCTRLSRLWIFAACIPLVAVVAAAAGPGRGMVVSVSPPASEVGAAVLREGGNAVDAAVAMAFALAVTWPSAGNIGGGGFMMVAPCDGRTPVCVEYRETAPAAANAETLAHYDRMDGHVTCGTPGTVAGLALAHGKFGKRPWQTLVLPAVRLARDGFAIDSHLAASLNGVRRSWPQFAELQRVFAPPGGRKQWQAGDRFLQPELAATLEKIADGGAAAFYTGPIADQFASEMRSGGGLVTKADLAAYKANLRTPITGTYRGYQICGAPPPSSGGIAIVEMLNILENFSLADAAGGATARDWSAGNLHLVIEAMRRAFADRARWLGDPAFTPVPAELTDKTYAKKLAAKIDPTRATPSKEVAPEIVLAPESSETTHFSVIDRSGMAVANTYTLENSYGCKVVVRGAGFLLNNEMTDFNRRPHHTDRRGAIGTAANLIAPGKRMLSSQSPTFVFRDGRLVLVTGSPGGRTIINTVLCNLVQYIDFQQGPLAMVAAPRLHQQWFPDEVSFEGYGRPEYLQAIEQLKRLGHRFVEKARKQGDAHSIGWDAAQGRYIAAPDSRIDGKAAYE